MPIPLDFHAMPRPMWVRYWEERSVLPRCYSARVLSLDLLRQLSHRAAELFDHPLPSVKFIDLMDTSRADPIANTVFLGFGDRWEQPALHHTASLIGSSIEGVTYGKVFMTAIIETYSVLLDIPVEPMERSANHYELEYLPNADLRKASTRRKALRSLS